MAQIQTAQAVSTIVDKLKLQAGVDALPNQSANYIQPVISSDSNTTFFKQQTRTSSGSVIVANAPSDKDLYITYIQFSYEKNAASDATSASVYIYDGTNTTYLIYIPLLTLTASRDSVVVSPDRPIKVNRGSNVQHIMTFTVGSATYSTVIGGYTE